MLCPECNYELTENEKLLCLVSDGHFCPRCWAHIKSDRGPAECSLDDRDSLSSRHKTSETSK